MNAPQLYDATVEYLNIAKTIDLYTPNLIISLSFNLSSLTSFNKRHAILYSLDILGPMLAPMNSII